MCIFSVLTEDSICARNQSLESVASCNEKCLQTNPIPREQLAPAVVVDPFFTHTIVVHFESDRTVVEKYLKELCGYDFFSQKRLNGIVYFCSFGTCQWACKRPIFESTCGRGTADRIEISYNLMFQTIPKLYLDLKVIDDIPDECKKYSLDPKSLEIPEGKII